MWWPAVFPPSVSEDTGGKRHHLHVTPLSERMQSWANATERLGGKSQLGVQATMQQVVTLSWNSHLLALNQDRKRGKNIFFLKKFPEQNQKMPQQSNPLPKPVLTETVRCLSGIDVYSYYSDCFEDQFPYSPNTIAFLFHICQAQYLSKYSCNKLWNMYG